MLALKTLKRLNRLCVFIFLKELHLLQLKIIQFMDFTDEQREAAIEAKKLNDKRQDNKQHCQKIDQGIAKLDSNSPSRAIWELVQNARDLSLECCFEIILKNDSITFKHKGNPFTPDTLTSLVKQVSSEEKENSDTVGQYGTGFLSTHIFSRIIKICGSLQIAKGFFINFKDFEIDRTYNNISEFIDKLVIQLDNVDKLMKEPVYPTPDEWTSLKYEFSQQDALLFAQEGIAKAIITMPYVMTINNRIKRCYINDNTCNHIIYFSKEDSEKEDGLNVTTIKITDNNKNILQKCYYLQSTDNKNIIILPLITSKKAVSYKDIAKLFLFFPLIGTENFGVNYIFHSNSFEPEESRDGIILPCMNPNVEQKYKHNSEVLESMFQMLFDYLQEHASTIDNSIELARINFFPTKPNDNKNLEFFKNIKSEWIKTFETLNIIPCGNERYNLKQGISYFSLEILKSINETENEQYRHVLYKYASINRVLPDENVCFEWSEVINNWGSDYGNKITFDAIAESIQRSNDNKDLKSLLMFLINCNKAALLNNYKMIPNREGVLKQATELRNAEEIPYDLYCLIKPLIPDTTSTFADIDYECINKYLYPYSRKELKATINTRISDERQRTINNSISQKCFDCEFIKQLINYCSAFPQSDSYSLRRKMMPLICELNGLVFKETIIPSISIDEDLYSTPFNALVENQMVEISSKKEEWVRSNSDQLKKFLSLIITSSSFQETAQKYKLYPNYKYQLAKREGLVKNNGVGEDLADLFSRAIGEDLHNKWVLEEFQDLTSETYPFVEQSQQEIAKQIEEQLHSDNYSSELTIEIIEKLDNNQWNGLFNDIENRKAEIFFTRVKGDNKKNVYKLMKKDGNTLELLATLSEDANLLSYIEKAKELLTRDKYRETDFAKKYEIGKRIEDLLREKISNDLSSKVEVSLTEKSIAIDDIQNGQDIIVKYDSEVIYYIEIKSKWSFGNDETPAYMSKNQMLMAARHPDNYALCCVNLSDGGFDNHFYPDLDTILKNTTVHLNIGHEVEDIAKPILSAEEDPSFKKIRIAGEYVASISKGIFISGASFNCLIEQIIKHFKIR